MKAREYARRCVGMAALLAVRLRAHAARAPNRRRPAPPPPPTADQQFEALAQRYLREVPEQSPVAATGLGDHRFDDRLDDVSAAGWQARARVRRALSSGARSPSIAAGCRAPTRSTRCCCCTISNTTAGSSRRCEDWRWNPLIYTRIAGDALYNLLAREFAPLPERLENLGKRLDEMPRFLAQVREVLEPARVPEGARGDRGEAERRPDRRCSTAKSRRRSRRCRRTSRKRCAPVIAKARSAISQHQIWLEKRLLPEAKGDFRLGAAALRPEARVRVVLAAVAPGDPRAGREPSSRPTRAAMYEIARRCSRARRGAPADSRQARAMRSSSARSRPRSSSRTRNARRATPCSMRRAPRSPTPRSFVREKNLVTLPDEPLEIIAMPEFQQGVALAYCDSPGAARGRAEDLLRRLTDPGAVDARADGFLPARIQHALDPQPHGPRGDAGPLSAARAREQVSVDAARGAGLRSVHRRLGGVRGARDGRRRATWTAIRS